MVGDHWPQQLLDPRNDCGKKTRIATGVQLPVLA